MSFRSGLRAACLPHSYKGFPLENLQGRPTIIGWGSTRFKGPTVGHLRQATVPIEDVASCDDKYKAIRRITIGNTQLCAGDGSSDTCQGDSGGAMLSQERDSPFWSIIGITSFGVECANERFPGVYTRVDQYLDWIERNTQ